MPKESIEFNYGKCEYWYQETDHNTGKWTDRARAARGAGRTGGARGADGARAARRAGGGQGGGEELPALKVLDDRAYRRVAEDRGGGVDG